MTTGALIFAFNNEQTDYVSMAAWSADNIHRHLDIPVAVVTDQPNPVGNFDRVIYAESQSGGTRYFEDYNNTVTWNNASRVNAFELSPWDQTLVLDADYVIASNTLKLALDAPHDFLCYKDAYDITLTADFSGLNWFGNHKLPMWWATVMMFRRTTQTEFIFDSMQMIRDNWQHYRDLYGIQNKTYRNDYALSIALGIVSGHTWRIDSLPGMMASAMPEHGVSKLDTDYYVIEFQDTDSKRKNMAWKGMDFHAMGKSHLEKIVAAD
jgi:hypothetical protein